MKITEHNFIKAIQRKDERGLLYVVEEYGWIIQTVVRKYLFRISDFEEECINDVLFAIWEGIDGFQPEISSFKNWVAGIAKFKAIDYKRKYLQKLTICSSIEDYDIKDNHAENQLIQMELQEEVGEILHQLSEKDSEIFKRVFMGEESVEEVAKRFGMKPDAVYQRISRGRKKLRNNKLYEIESEFGNKKVRNEQSSILYSERNES